MPRSSRQQSISGNYHIVIRGVNKQRIFEAPQDYDKFYYVLMDQKEKYHFSVFAFCLMSNHVHLLINERSTPFGHVMRGLAAKYVGWFNNKYHRSGQLFENRYRSEPVDEEDHFLRTVRYIHLNPVKAGICREPSEYPYSSYKNYFNKGKDSDVLFGLIERKSFELYHQEKADDICLDIDEEPYKRVPDEHVVRIINRITGLERPAMISDLSSERRESAVLSLLKAGISAKQINRLTGLSLGMIEYIRDKH